MDGAIQKVPKWAKSSYAHHRKWRQALAIGITFIRFTQSFEIEVEVFDCWPISEQENLMSKKRP
jgi:hypothetical protein